MNEKRASGVLLHISSLPSPYGIGTFGKEAYRFVDFLEASGQKCWQVLPLGPTGYGDSPYQVISSFAGNPYFIDLDMLIEEGLLEEDDLEGIDFGGDDSRVDFQKLFEERIPILKKAYSRGKHYYNDRISQFRLEHELWVEDYALFMALKYKYNHRPYYEWDEDIVKREPMKLKELEVELKDEIDFWIFLQSIFLSQWKKLKSYANSAGIEILGDVPIYVGRDSVDVWASPEVFCLDEDYSPRLLSGVPPDDFSADGQLWGNPVYDWEYLEQSGYIWWADRLSHDMEMFDKLRMDHFRGFESFWVVSSGSDTAKDGTWVSGPGIEFFKYMENHIGGLDIIAEDLGFLTEDVYRLKEGTGYMGMKIIQFAFDGNPDNPYLPHNYEKNSVVYTGTHDNDTISGWIDSLDRNTREYVADYLNVDIDGNLRWELIRMALSSSSRLSIVQIQDILGLRSEARMNIPSTRDGNWSWRMGGELELGEVSEKLKRMTKLYGR